MPWPKGRTRSPEERAKIAAGLKGKPRPPEVRAKIAAGKKGKKPSMSVRVRQSLQAMNDGRIEQINRKRATDPVWAARQARQSSERLKAWHVQQRQEKATRRPAERISAQKIFGLMGRWEATRDLTKLAPPRVDGGDD